MWVGFPHSDIPGSKLVCQLPGAFRRLPRPSSPVIAKASTTCTLVLDPITLRPQDCSRRLRLQVYFSACVAPIAIELQTAIGDTYNLNPATPRDYFHGVVNFFQIVKEQTVQRTEDRGLKTDFKARAPKRTLDFLFCLLSSVLSLLKWWR